MSELLNGTDVANGINGILSDLDIDIENAYENMRENARELSVALVGEIGSDITDEVFGRSQEKTRSMKSRGIFPTAGSFKEAMSNVASGIKSAS